MCLLFSRSVGRSVSVCRSDGQAEGRPLLKSLKNGVLKKIKLFQETRSYILQQKRTDKSRTAKVSVGQFMVGLRGKVTANPLQ